MTAPAPEKAAPIPALLPCPFCGSPNDELMLFCDPCEGLDNSGPSRRIQCAGCNVKAPFYPTKSEAVEAWNRRADREARPSLPDSREERIREDEREACIELASQYCWTRYKDRPPAHLREPAVFTSHEWHKIADAMRAERQNADRARQGGNNG